MIYLFTSYQEKYDVRSFLEKEIQRLQEEISRLKIENRKINTEKSLIELQAQEQKKTSDETIVKLRGIWIFLFHFEILFSFPYFFFLSF